jgi:hypothetical protein
MARELLQYQVTVDTSQGTASLRSMDQVAKDVDSTLKKLGMTEEEIAKDRAAFAKLSEEALRRIERGTSTLEKETKKLGDTTKAEASTMSSALTSLGQRIVAVFAVERLISFGTQVVNTAGHINDLSAKTGLSTTAIQKFGYAANLSGSSIDAVANAISAMSRNLVSGGGAVEALNKLGLSQRELLRLEPEQAFLRITEAIRSMKNPMEQAEVTMRIFGKGGKEILPAIKDGFAEAGDEAQRLGAVMSEQTVRDLDDLGDAWGKAYATMQGRAAGLLAIVVRIGGSMSELAGQLPAWTSRWTGALTSMTNIPGWAVKFLEEAETQKNWVDWQRGRTPMPTDGGDVTRGFGSPSAGYQAADLDTLLAVTKEVDTATGRLGETKARMTQAVRVQEAAVVKLTEAQQFALGGMQDYRDEITRTAFALLQMAEAQRLAAEAQRNFDQFGIYGINPGYGNVPGTSLIPNGNNPIPGYTTMPGGISGNMRGGRLVGSPPPGGGFWSGQDVQQAAGIGIGMAGSAAMGALAGGDQYAGMVGTGASLLAGVALKGAITSTVALGAATMGIGAAAVGVYMLVKHFASVSKEVKQARVEVDAFQEGLWKTMTAQQVNEAGGEKWAATLIVVRDAYERMGLTAAQAEGDVAKLFDTRNPDQAREAMARINGVVSDYRAILAGVNEQMGDLLTQADALGIRLPQALLDSLNAAVQLGDMTEENARLIASLTQASEVDWEKFEEAAQRYGIAVDALGQQFQQHQISKTAQQMVDDMDLLLRGGATMGTILYGMKEEISTVVQNAMKFGTELPENMRPWIDELMKAGLLVDAQGQALTDITNLKFGETMQTTFQRVADSIQELVDLLKGPLTNALDTVGTKVVKPRVEVEVSGGGDGSIWDGTRNGYAHGGVVYAAGGWVPRGTDTVPAMLTPGEGVLSRRGMAMLGALNAGMTGGGGSPVSVAVNLQGALLNDRRQAEVIAEQVGAAIVRQLSRERKFAAVIQ